MQGKRALPLDNSPGHQSPDPPEPTPASRRLFPLHLNFKRLPSLPARFASWWGNSISLRSKTFLIILTSLLVFLVALVVPVRTSLLNSFASLENDQLLTDFDRARNGVDLEVDSIARLTSNYAAWDQTYSYVETRDPTYLDLNINDQFMQNFRLNLVVIYDQAGNVIARKSYNYLSMEHSEPAAYFSRPGIASDPLLSYADPKAGNKGIILLPEGPIMLAAYPILPDDNSNSGEPRGSLLIGRFIKQDSVDRLAESTRLNVSFQGITSLDPTLRETLAGSGPALIRPLNDNFINALGYLSGFYGEPAIAMSLTEQRTIYAYGRDAVSFLTATVVVVIIALIGLALIMIERVILSRLLRLSMQVTQIGAEGNPLARLTIGGKDEIAQVGKAINGMLEALEQTSLVRKETEAGYRAVVEQTAESVFLIDPSTGYFIETNAAFCELLGYTDSELSNLTIYDVMLTDGPLIDRHIRDVLTDGHSRLVERKYRRKDGAEVDVEESSATIRRNGTHVLCFLAHDLTERRVAEEERARRKSEERFRAMVQNAADVITIINTDGSIRYQSPSIEPMLGFKTGNLIGMSIFDNLHPSDAHVVIQTIAELIDKPGRPRRMILRIHHIDMSWRFVEIVATNHLRDSNVGGIILNMRDVSERKALEERLIHQASHDPLTGLPNRTYFSERLAQALNDASTSRSLLAVMFVDLDNFKLINDSLGHQAGDLFLIEIANRLRKSVRTFDTVARFGGDEFTLLLEDLDSNDAAIEVAERIQQSLLQPFMIDRHELSVECSVGIAFSQGNALTPDLMIRNADIAVYRAKANGKARITVFDTDMNQYALQRLEMEIDLRRAIDRDELVVYYQPVLDLLTGNVSAVEALVRWQSPTRGLVSPLDFISLAEETALIIPLGRWVLKEACMQAQIWKRTYRGAHDLVVCVNVSGRQFRHKGLVSDVADALEVSGLPPESLKLEITETVGIEDPDQTLLTLQELKSMGVKLALDDFGMGYSSLSYLKRFPVDTLKLDRSFVSGLGKDRQDTAVVYAAVSFAKALHLTITAEGVETRSQVELLRALDCEHGQGFYFSAPLPAKEMANFLRVHDPSVQTMPLVNATRTAI